MQWVEVNLDHLEHNLEVMHRTCKPASIFAVIKGNAYNHGMIPVARMLDGHHLVTHLAAGREEDAVLLRKEGITSPILLLSPYFDENKIVANTITPTITSVNDLHKLYLEVRKQECRKPYPFHLKINTGMNRFGLQPDELETFLEVYKDYSRTLALEGCFSHLSNGLKNKASHSLKQKAVFEKTLETIRGKGIEITYAHLAASHVALGDSRFHFDAVRTGNALYGQAQNSKQEFKHALTWKTRIQDIYNVPAGESIGYGLSRPSKEKKRVAVIPVGTVDGLGLVRQAPPESVKDVIRQILKTGYHYLKAPSPFQYGSTPLRPLGKQGMEFTLLDITAHPDITIGSEVRINSSLFALPSQAEVVYVRDRKQVHASNY
ncbi:alanine racemase [Alteribacter lacisalsi]|uniref:alanine racemase n=1 Tax=Alteribacter lacisalsi TaxID=2045244 RepID=UPI001374C974|nr:alanine racemase [Alteribacter lacisalsi]